MKQFFEPHIPARPVLSLEEEAIAISEADDAQAEVTKSEAELSRLVDVTKGVGDVETIVANVPSVAQDEKELIAAVGEMAVAGTDADPTELISIGGDDPQVATEAFADSLKSGIAKVWAKIKEMIKKAWEQVKKFFSSINDRFNPARRRLLKLKEEQEKEAAELKAKKQADAQAHAKYLADLEKQFMQLSNPPGMLFADGEFSTHLLRDMDAAFEYLFIAMGDFPKKMLTLGECIERAIRQKQQNVDSMADALVKDYEKIFKECAVEFKLIKIDGALSYNTTWPNTKLLGDIGGCYSHSLMNAFGNANSAFDKLAVLGNSRIKFGHGNRETRPVKVRPLTVEQAEAVCNASLTWLDSIDNIRATSIMERLTAQVKRIESFADEILKTNGTSSDFARNIAYICSSYSNMASLQTMNIYSAASLLVGEVSMYARQCLEHRRLVADGNWNKPKP